MRNKDYIEHLQKRLKYTHRLLYKATGLAFGIDGPYDHFQDPDKGLDQLERDIKRTLKEKI